MQGKQLTVVTRQEIIITVQEWNKKKVVAVHQIMRLFERNTSVQIS